MLKLSANRFWKFYRGEPPKGRVVNSKNPHDHGLAPCDLRYDDSEWETVHLPHTVREERLNCSGGYNYMGECWYRKKFFVKKEWTGKHLFLELEGAMQRADVWLDGAPLGVRYGGFTPDGFDLSHLSEGEHLIVIKLDNSDCYDIPPGKPQGELDFCYFGGLYRNVFLYVADRLHFSHAVHQNKVASGGLFIRYPFVSEKRADVRVRAHIVNGHKKAISGEIRLLVNGKSVASQTAEFSANNDAEYDFEFTIDNPKLWSPHEPNLYDFTAQILIDGVVIDERKERMGIKEISFEKNGVVINGKKQFLNGVNRHQEYPYVGFALPNATQYRDLKMLREMGVLCIRIAHYPPDSTFMNYCDELGILCIIPTPGWQIHPSSVEFDLRSYENTRRIVRWHRNHASVMAWEPILNETDYPEYFALEQIRCVKEECADGQCYYGSDLHSRCSDLFPLHLQLGNDKNIPAFVREYGDSYIEQYGPMATTYRVRRGKNTGFYTGGEGPMLWSANARLERYRYLLQDTVACGGCVWAGIDHNRGYEPTEGAVGMLDFFRLKKYSYQAFECQQEIENAGAKCFIANDWTENSPKDITVYTNAEKVRLLLNGKEVGTLATGAQNGWHPPVVFKSVQFEKGTLIAEAIVDGKIVQTHEVRTPEKAVALQLIPQWAGVNAWVADGADLLMVHVFAIDENGTVVPDFEEEIEFFVEGDASIVGEDQSWVGANPVHAEAGKSGVLLRAGVQSGNVLVKAVSKGLKTAELSLITEENTRAEVECQAYPKTEKKPVYTSDATELFSIRESIKNTQSSRWDVGVEKKAFASSFAQGHGAENANRKTMSSPWIAENANLPQWWACDLGDTYDLNGVFIGWEKDGLWYDYDVEISNDNVTYTRVVQGRASGQTRKPDRFPVGTKARYVRVLVRSVSSNEPVGIYHVEIFGKPKE